MRMRLAAAALVVVICISTGFLLGASPAAPAKWEYRSYSDLAGATETANKLGADGWELVGIIGPTGSKSCYFYFKRPLP
jgi:hypothetical protein